MTCAAMVESIQVRRQCWWGLDGLCDKHRIELGLKQHALLREVDPLNALVQFTVDWTMPDGNEMTDSKMYRFGDLMNLPEGAVPMTTLVYALPHEGHPGACTQGMVYLLRVYDQKHDCPDVVARFLRRENPHEVHAEDDFFMPGKLAENGPGIYPLTIKEVAGWGT